MRWKPLALSAIAATVLVGLSIGVSYAQFTGGQTPIFTAPPGSPEALSTLHITGFVNSTFGTFINTEAIEWRGSKNSLSSARQLLQIDVNDNLTENDQVFLRLWGVYEPPYPAESGNCPQGNAQFRGYGLLRGAPAAPPRPAGACNSDFYSDYNVPREFWVKHRWGPLQLFIGKQLTVWGESVAFRAMDQINPVNTSYAFGFANLEDSRMPVWMIHPILNLPDLGPAAANFIELVYVPGVDYLWSSVDYSNDQYDGQDAVAGRVSLGAQNPNAARFSVRANPATVIATPPGAPAPRAVASAWPLVMYQVGGPAGTGFYTPTTYIQIPRATWGNSQVFIRLHTLLYDTEMTAAYAWSHDYGSVFGLTNNYQVVSAAGHVYSRDIRQFYPQWMGGGMTANKPLYLPGPLAQLPFVARFEAFYKNHEAYNTKFVPGTYYTNWNTGIGSPTAVTRSDVVYWILGLDLDSAFVPELSTTGSLTMNFEIDGTSILSPSKYMVPGPTLQPVYHNDIGGSINIADSWWWGAIAPAWTMSYNPNGETFLLFPGVTLTPPWTTKYFMALKWIEILGTNPYGFDGGAFKGESTLEAIFQYNFAIM